MYGIEVAQLLPLLLMMLLKKVHLIRAFGQAVLLITLHPKVSHFLLT